jgi:hypothetical protein
MKTKMKWMALLPLLAGLAACDDFGWGPQQGEPGILRWTLQSLPATRATAEMPDTNDFLLTVRDARGNILYDGAYGDSPTSLQVEAGSYTVRIVSAPFPAPAFATPQYGDEQLVVVPAGQTVSVGLRCTLLNAGIRLSVAPEFLESYPDGVLSVRQGQQRLLYGYTEKRIAYFPPGEVSVILSQGGTEQTLLTRSLQARDILSIKLSAPGSRSGGRISVSVDTTKNWRSENFRIGGGSADGDPAEELVIGVADAASHVGETGIWVYGYIVGGDLTSAGKYVKTSGITKATHLALASRSSVTEKAQCVAVELPAGKVRERLNLVDHPELIGTRVSVKGNLVSSYFGTIGLKGTNDYTLK